MPFIVFLISHDIDHVFGVIGDFLKCHKYSSSKPKQKLTQLIKQKNVSWLTFFQSFYFTCLSKPIVNLAAPELVQYGLH